MDSEWIVRGAARRDNQRESGGGSASEEKETGVQAQGAAWPLLPPLSMD